MTSDKERREVAKKLRELAADYEKAPTWSVVARDKLPAPIDCLMQALGLTWIIEMTEVYYRLADLIDRPTCEMRAEGEGFRCSACGEFHDMSGFDRFPWAYCPNCGAEVVRDGR